MAKTMQKTLGFLYYPFIFTIVLEKPNMRKPLRLLLYGTDTPHDPEFVVNRPAPRQDWIVLCFRTPFLLKTKTGLELGNPGDCVVHDANFSEWHTTLEGSIQGFRNDWLHIGAHGMKEVTNRYGVPLNQRIPTGFSAFLNDNLRNIATEDHRREQFWDERIGIELETIFLRIGRAWANHNAGETLTSTERSHFEHFKVIRSTMLEHFQQPWTVQSLATLADMSANRFSVLYALFFKISPIEELIQHRLKQSCMMLVSSDNNLEEIADACGFTDASYFSRVFKQRMGCNPGAYRTMGAPQVR